MGRLIQKAAVMCAYDMWRRRRKHGVRERLWNLDVRLKIVRKARNSCKQGADEEELPAIWKEGKRENKLGGNTHVFLNKIVPRRGARHLMRTQHCRELSGMHKGLWRPV
jgi:hypothetical protein